MPATCVAPSGHSCDEETWSCHADDSSSEEREVRKRHKKPKDKEKKKSKSKSSKRQGEGEKQEAMTFLRQHAGEAAHSVTPVDDQQKISEDVSFAADKASLNPLNGSGQIR